MQPHATVQPPGTQRWHRLHNWLTGLCVVFTISGPVSYIRQENLNSLSLTILVHISLIFLMTLSLSIISTNQDNMHILVHTLKDLFMIAILTDYQLMILNTLRHKYDYCTVTKLCLSRCRSTWKVEHSSKTLLVVHSRGATGPNAGKSSTVRLMLLTGMMSYLDNVRMRMVVAGQKRAAHRGAWTCHGVSRMRHECVALAHLQLSASKIKGSDFADTFCAQKTHIQHAETLWGIHPSARS